MTDLNMENEHALEQGEHDNHDDNIPDDFESDEDALSPEECKALGIVTGEDDD